MTPQQINRLVDDEVGSSPDSIVIFAEALAQAAYETASHMRSDWQDARMARIWEKIGKEYDSVAARVNKLYGMMT